MPANHKVLGQTAPGAAVDSTLYTAPAGAGNYALVSGLIVANRAGATTFRVRIAINNAAVANAQYVFYDVILDANDTQVFVMGITLGGNDSIVCQSASGNVAFTTFGLEVTP